MAKFLVEDEIYGFFIGVVDYIVKFISFLVVLVWVRIYLVLVDWSCYLEGLV